MLSANVATVVPNKKKRKESVHSSTISRPRRQRRVGAGGGGNPIVTPATIELNRRRLEQKKYDQQNQNDTVLDPFETFFLQLLNCSSTNTSTSTSTSNNSNAARTYLEAATNPKKAELLWKDILQHMQIRQPKKPLQGWCGDLTIHFNDRAALVLEESRFAICDALVKRWNKNNTMAMMTTPTATSAIAPTKANAKDNLTMKMILQMRGPEAVLTRKRGGGMMIHKLQFELPPESPGFTKEQLVHLRPGTVVECLPSSIINRVGSSIFPVDSILLGVVCSTNRKEAEKYRSFTVFVTERDFLQAQHSAGTRCWCLHPLTSLLSEFRQFETARALQGRLVQVPFMDAMLGQVPPCTEHDNIESSGSSSIDDDDCSDEVDNLQDQWNMPKLNEKQKMAAKEFLNSPSGSLTLCQGPPGTGKTTMIVSIILQYIQQLPNNRLMVCAPTNKAVTVLASRFMTAIRNSYDTASQNINVVLVGEADKLMENESSLKPIFLYYFFSNLLHELKSLQRALDQTRSSKQLTKKQQESWTELQRLLHQFQSAVSFLEKDTVKCTQQLQEDLETLLKEESTLLPPANHRDRMKLGVETLIEKVTALSKNDKASFLFHQSIVRHAHIIFCTLTTAGGSIFKAGGGKTQQTVNDLIVDEAGAAKETELCIPFHLRPSRLCAIGDPKQLPATVMSPVAKNFSFDRSLHERLMVDCKYPYIMLTKQYRMKEEISKFPSKRFYRGKLKNSAHVKSRRYIAPVKVLRDDQSFIFQQVQGREKQTNRGSYENKAEAMAVVEWIETFRSKAVAQHDTNWSSSTSIRVISFYQAQVALISSLLRARGMGSVLVATVDASQGSESNLVILSFVRSCSSETSARHGAGFLMDDRRINVALTRAKYELICIGNVRNMSCNSTLKTLQKLGKNAMKRKLTIGTEQNVKENGQEKSVEYASVVPSQQTRRHKILN